MQSLQILLAELSIDHLIDNAPNAAHLTVAGQLQTGVDALFDGLVTAITGEDEIDAGQHIEKVQLVHYGPAFGSMPLHLM